MMIGVTLLLLAILLTVLVLIRENYKAKQMREHIRLIMREQDSEDSWWSGR